MKKKDLKIIELRKNNNDVQRILNSYLKNQTETVEPLNEYVPELNSFDLCAIKQK